MKTVKIRGEDAPPCITPVRKVMIAHLGVGESRVGGADTANPAPNARRTRTRTPWARRRVPPVPRPAHSEAPPRSDARTDCVCSLGFSGPAGGPCAECPANAYAEALNMSACTACLANSEAPAGATRRGLSVQPRLLRCAGRALRRVRGERVRGRAGHGGVLRLSGELAGARAQRRANGLCLPPRLLRRSRRELKWKVFSS